MSDRLAPAYPNGQLGSDVAYDRRGPAASKVMRNDCHAAAFRALSKFAGREQSGANKAKTYPTILNYGELKSKTALLHLAIHSTAVR
jgi:hypothetical protein